MGVRLLVIWCLALAFAPCYGKDDLGSLSDAIQKYPAAFRPGNVVELPCHGEQYYFFNGAAEQLFSGRDAEPDRVLYREAVLDAKRNFYRVMTRGDQTKSVSMSHVEVAYQYVDGRFRRVVLLVPRRNVVVSAASLTKGVSSTNLISQVFAPTNSTRDRVRRTL